MARGVRYPRAIAKTKAIKFALIEDGLTQEQLAKRIERHPTHLSVIVNARQACEVWIAEDIAKGLGRKVEDLFTIEHRPAAARAA